jgi:GxxExxY protein
MDETPSRHDALPDEVERWARVVVDAGLKVHKALGPGLLESAYEHCLTHELQARVLAVTRQVPLPIVYDGAKIDAGYRIDILVEQSIILELKAVEIMTPLHRAQALTYLKLSGLRLGFLINFTVELFKNGVKRIVI